MKPAVALAVLCCAGVAAAQEGGGAAGRRCIDLRTDLARYYGCLNDDLKRLVPPDAARANPALPYSATTSPANRVGGFTIAGTRQMLGRNFGVSNRPDRVPRSTAPSALVRGR